MDLKVYLPKTEHGWKTSYDYNLSRLQRLIYIYGPLKHEPACDSIKIFESSNPFTDQALNMSLIYGNQDLCSQRW